MGRRRRSRGLEPQPRLVEGVIRASGIGRLVELRRRFQDILDRPAAGSDFVDLSNAAFTHLAMKGPEAVTVDLGLIGKYSKHPHRKYDALYPDI